MLPNRYTDSVIVTKDEFICGLCGRVGYGVTCKRPDPKGLTMFDTCPIGQKGDHEWHRIGPDEEKGVKPPTQA